MEFKNPRAGKKNPLDELIEVLKTKGVINAADVDNIKKAHLTPK